MQTPMPAVPPLLGNGRALACRRAVTSAGSSAGCVESISAAAPATSGDEKLVPTEGLKLSV